MKEFKIDVLNKGDELYADILREYKRLQQEGNEVPMMLSITREGWNKFSDAQRKQLEKMFERFQSLD